MLYTTHICLYCRINLFTELCFPLNLVGAERAPNKGIIFGVQAWLFGTPRVAVLAGPIAVALGRTVGAIMLETGILPNRPVPH